MKKTLALLLTAAMALSMTACGGSAASSSAAPAPSAAGSAPAASQADTATWPASKNVEVVCPATAGSATDGVCRALADMWGKMYPDHNFTVTNDASGGYTVAYEMGRNGDADGSTILVGTSSMLTTYYFGVYDQLVTDPNAFKVINSIDPNFPSFVICVAGDSEWETLDDLVAAAKASPNTLSVGTGSGNMVYVNAMCIENALGVTLRKVDGSDNNERITNLLGGFNDIALLPIATAEQYVETGDMKILGYCGNERNKDYPDIPCLDELGYHIDNIFNQQYIICTTPEMSDEMAEEISATLENLNDNEMWQTLITTGALKGCSWDYYDRAEGINVLNALDETCKTLNLGV